MLAAVKVAVTATGALSVMPAVMTPAKAGARTGIPPGAARGFTIIELMVTAVVVVVIMLGALAGLRSFQAQKQLQGLAQNLVADLQLARSSALGSAQAVVLRTAADGRSYRVLRCAPDGNCSTGVDTVKAVELPPEVAVTAGRSFEFAAPRAVLRSAAQSACLTGANAPTVLKVAIDNPVGKAAACGVGEATSGLPACSAGC